MHEHFITPESDDNFDTGTFAHLAAGNEGRVLDGRRTPGYIESYDNESGMFKWRITAFEDKGKVWEIPADEISCYQFRKKSRLLTQSEIDEIALTCKKYQERLEIKASKADNEKTQAEIAGQEAATCEWLRANSNFLDKNKTLDMDLKAGDEDLFSDLENYLNEMSVLEQEKKTADQYLLNPYSGEWIKGMKITMAEMGMIDYSGTITRTKDVFLGIGEKRERKRYIIARAAFVRALFKLCGFTEVPLFRGMSSEKDFYAAPSSLLSATFSAQTAMDFASVDNSSAFRSCYWLKFTCPVDDLFMTYLETKQFNERYQEQEAIIFYKRWS